MKLEKEIENNNIRGSIFDRENNLLASTIKISSLNINPYEVMNKHETIFKLKKIFPLINKNTLLKKLNSKKRHVNLIREISPGDHLKILEMGIEGIDIQSVNKRIYPGNTLAAHILGNTNIDGKGIAGIEKSFDNHLRVGKNINLSIHAGIQHILKTEIQRQINNYEAEGGAGIIMDVKTGEVYALASLPDYNANNYKKILRTDAKLFNKATKGIYELGSTLKLITAAIAYESKLVLDNDVFDVSKPLKISSRTISDYHPLNYAINIPEVIVRSSNIGSAKIAEKFGSKTQLKYLKSLGLMDKLPLEIPEVGKPSVRTDKKLLTTMTISYGHSIAITPIHLTSATATIVNGGIRVKPTLLVPTSNNNNQRIFSEKTSLQMRSIMRLVVNNKYGTAKKANAPGYVVGGKTGTAEKLNQSGGYSKKKNIAAFTAAFPMNKPRFVITIMIDNPKGQLKSFGYRDRTGGWVAAPVVNKIVTRIAPILNIKPTLDSSKVLTENLIQYKIRGNRKGAEL
jgi:cell division protein FtsI (penicillin-binding protein 3)